MSFFRKVTPMDRCCLQIEMATGSIIRLDLSPKLESTRLCPLKDPEVFRNVTIDGDFLVFDNQVRLGATELMEMVMLPGD